MSALDDIQVLRPDGNAIDICSLWQQRPVVLVFLRHFG